MVKNGKNSILKQLSGRLNGLKKLKQADFKSKLTIPTGIIQSTIEYLLSLYGGAADYLIKRYPLVKKTSYMAEGT